jgi:hypothetical protein
MQLSRAILLIAGASGLCVLVAYAQTVWSFTTPAEDQTIAKHFRMYSARETLTTRIDHVRRASRGQMPDHVTISRSVVRPFVSGQLDSASVPANIPVRLLSAVANSDEVVLGVPLQARSLPTSDQTFLFTEYQVRVDRVFYSATNGLTPGQSIVVSKAGGTMTVGGVRVDAVEPDFDPLQTDHSYIFCLHSFDATGTYVATGFDTYLLQDGFALHSSKVEAARAVAPPETVAEFLIAVQTAAERKAATARR